MLRTHTTGVRPEEGISEDFQEVILLTWGSRFPHLFHFLVSQTWIKTF